MKIPEETLRRFREFGREGGRERARRLSPASRRSIARKASVARWTRARFGVGRFEELGLPGAALVDRGLSDVAEEVETVEALLVALAAGRLRREGVPVPTDLPQDPERRCYRLIEQQHGELAHARYNALRRQICSFADACHLVRAAAHSHAQ